MANTPSNAIPFVPENTIDPAAGLNLALDVIDALLNTRVVNMTTNTPPGSPADGDAYVVGPSPTGAWVGHSKAIARYIADGAFWEFFAAGVQAWLVINKADGKLYIWTVATSTWTVASGVGLTNPMTTKGDLIVGDTGGAPVRLPIGTTGQVLTVAGSTWVAATPVAPVADTAVSALSITSGVVNIDLSLGDLFTLALTSAVTSITFTNLPASGRGRSISIRMKQDATGSRAVALPASFKAITGSDTAIQSGANAYTILNLSTFDQGTRWEYAMKGGAV